MNYYELKEKQSAELNQFPICFAFNQKHFDEAKEKLGVENNSDLRATPGGGIIKKTNVENLANLWRTQKEEMEKHMADDLFMLDAIKYELSNHEYSYTYDESDTIEALGLDIKNPRTLTILNHAKKEYLEEHEKWESEQEMKEGAI